MTQYRIGIDGTIADRNALAWIERNVRPDGDRVEIVLVGGQQHAGMDEVRAGWLLAARQQLHQRHRQLVITDDVSETKTAAAATSGADVLVIGVRQASPIARALSGWVPERVTANSTIPVIAVPEHWEERPGSVVVGVDADTSGAALQFAAERALAAGCEMTIVRAWQVPTVSTPYGYAYVEEDRAIWARQAEELVAHFARIMLEQFPGLRIRTAVRKGRAGDVIAGLSTSASLLVVGRRHHTLFGGALFGSVGQQLLRDSGIPVATVPPDATVRSSAANTDAQIAQLKADIAVRTVLGAR
ncbi:universal stress protein [Curtobacterium sp. VKM Ac-2884]|uniref:universal stress protein n=1 Tax=Curtobacterium sp. VKM Ac-2884 TaxID=2783818 RepID=UPI00188AF750|nr:universal stress protein [Curtobacterium sp. VKM Ac-2884]MBF4604015.1 universal stress protein [Curtobacterium sp. VKM Ac-2884]